MQFIAQVEWWSIGFWNIWSIIICMLIIGHRGAAGLEPENTLEALRAGFKAGSDILEFDIRITSDGIPVLSHNPVVEGKWVSRHTLAQLRNHVPITTLREVLDTFFGKILLNIELKQSSGAEPVYELVRLYINRPADWDNVLFSSFKPSALMRLRALDSKLSLALLHHINPFAFMRYQRRLKLSAVGFHRLHINAIALMVAKELDIFTYAYTVDNPSTAARLERRGIDGIVTNVPGEILEGLTQSA